MDDVLHNYVERKVNIWLLNLNWNWVLNNEQVTFISNQLESEDFKSYCQKFEVGISEVDNYSYTCVSSKWNPLHSEISAEYNIVLYKNDSKISDIVDEKSDGTFEDFFVSSSAGKEKKRRIFQRSKIIFFKHPDFFEQDNDTKKYFGIVLTESTQGISYNFSSVYSYLNGFITSLEDGISENKHIGIEKVIDQSSLNKLYEGNIDWISINLTANNWFALQSLNQAIWVSASWDWEQEFAMSPTNNEQVTVSQDNPAHLKVKFQLETESNQTFFKSLWGYISDISEHLFSKKKQTEWEESALYWNLRFKANHKWYSFFDLALSFHFYCKILDGNEPRHIVANTDSEYFFLNVTNKFLEKEGLFSNSKIDLKKLFSILNTFKDEEQNTSL
jgi:hypothetical protein